MSLIGDYYTMHGMSIVGSYWTLTACSNYLVQTCGKYQQCLFYWADTDSGQSNVIETQADKDMALCISGRQRAGDRLFGFQYKCLRHFV